VLQIFICEDSPIQRGKLENTIRNYIVIEDLEIELAVSTDDPQDILTYLEKYPETTGLYFLDIDLQREMTGIALASKIREIDLAGKIVFITAHGELMYLTFFHQIEALDYIVKSPDFSDIKRRVITCIRVAYKRHISEKTQTDHFFKMKVGSKTRMIPFSEIMFFTTSAKPHKLVLHLKSSQLGFMSSMKEIEEYSPKFVRIHTSYIVNTTNIATIDRKGRAAIMKNGEKCLISVRGLKELDKVLV